MLTYHTTLGITTDSYEIHAILNTLHHTPLPSPQQQKTSNNNVTGQQQQQSLDRCDQWTTSTLTLTGRHYYGIFDDNERGGRLSLTLHAKSAGQFLLSIDL